MVFLSLIILLRTIICQTETSTRVQKRWRVFIIVIVQYFADPQQDVQKR